MTALANLSALVASWRREADDMERAGVSPSTTLAIRANADELDAAIATLSPAELGGVPVAWRSRMPGDTRWVLTEHEPTVPGIEKQPLYTTPRADEAWQPIESAPRDGLALFWIQWGDVPVVGRWDGRTFTADSEHHDVRCGGYCYGGQVCTASGAVPTHWRPLPSPPSPGAAK